ncbi:MAG TPA: ABC transporter substrate-binding protein [Gaiellaceae bacterium]|nr:ABC transporter substrate-binding protein [Gaiellaceae bacterium]
MPAGQEGGLTGRTTRRQFVKRAGIGAGGLVLSGAAAQPIWARPKSFDASNTIKLGFISPITGPASGFGEPDHYVIGLAKAAFAKGLTVGGQHYAVEIHQKDGQSTPSASAQAASDLLHSTNVDLMLTTSTPEVVNPVSDASEAAGTPCISTVVPWEAWYFGRGAKPGKPSPFRYTYHFCFGVANFYDTYTHLWKQVPNNKKVGVMYPNDADGNAIRASLKPLLEKAGYTIVDPGAYQDGTNDYSSQIAKFKQEGVQIFNTFPIPPDFATFWRQAAQQGLTKQIKIAQIAKTGLFASQVSALGSLGFNLASGAYWGPSWPYESSLTGIKNAALGSGYEKHSGNYWNQQAGPSLALFDVAAAVLKKSGNPKDKNAVANAMKGLKVMTPLGELHWGGGGAKNPVPNVVATPIPGGQWVKGSGKYKYEWVFCEHSDDPKVPIQAKLKPYNA